MSTHTTLAKGLVLGLAALVALAAGASGIGCGAQAAPVANAPGQAAATAADRDDDDHDAHVHEPMFGGALHPLGDHFANLEVLLESDGGTLSVFVLDGCAENPIRIATPEIVVRVAALGPAAGPLTTLPEAFEMTLRPVESDLTGERVGAAAKFVAQSERLVGMTKLEGNVVTPFEVRGKMFDGVPVRLPGGVNTSHSPRS